MRDETFGRDLPAPQNAITRFYLAVVKALDRFRFYHQRNERYAALIRSLLGPSLLGDGHVLDLGCGPGGVTAKLPGVRRLVGIDSDRYYLTRFVEPSIPRIQARAERLPIKDHRVGVIIAISLVEHISDQAGFFRELARVLKPGAPAILQFPELTFPIEPHTKVPLLYAWNPTLQSRILAATGYRDLNLSTSWLQVIRCAEEAGFRVDRMLPLWHFRLARIMGKPMGYLVVLKKGA